MALEGNEKMAAYLAALDALDKTFFTGDEPARLQALDKARALCSRLETPWESLTRIIWQEPSISTAAKVAADLRLFDYLPSTPNELAQKTNADSSLIRRVLRLLASVHIVTQTEHDAFDPTDFSVALTKPGYVGGIDSMFYDIVPTYSTLPAYLARNGFHNPTSQMDPPFKTARGMSYFEWLGADKGQGDGFRELMAEFSNLNVFKWTEVYPLSRIADGFLGKPPGVHQEPSPLIVDVGGGLGTSMDILRRALLSSDTLNGHGVTSEQLTVDLVVEDLATVVAEGQKQHPELTFVTHDFFTPQPIRGARAYFLRNILHDWPDEKARVILRHLKDAMAAGSSGDPQGSREWKSKLLLEENVMFDQATDVASEAMDFVMMGLLGATERDESKWKTLLAAEGFEIVKVWRGVGTARAVVEAELADGEKL